MDIPDNVVADLKTAGGDSIAFNSPLSYERANALVDRLAEYPIDSVVDLGCGRGELARIVARRIPAVSVVGVDLDANQVAKARALTEAVQLQDRVRFEVADATKWHGPVAAATCVGASHAFGGSYEMLKALGHIVPSGPAVIGAAVWDSEPDPWCLETFGLLPAGPDALAAEADRAGWSVLGTYSSSPAEWDGFEQGWISGVRAVGTAPAQAFALQRELDYERYRGVLGFCWLFLHR